MDFGNMLGDSFAYAKDAVVGKWMQWLLLVIEVVAQTNWNTPYRHNPPTFPQTDEI